MTEGESLTLAEAIERLIAEKWWFPHGQPEKKSVLVSDLKAALEAEPTPEQAASAKEDEGKETPNISVPDSAKQATDLMRLRDEFKWAWQAGSFDEKTRLRTIHQDYIDRKIREFNALIDALQEAHSERDSAQEGKA